MTETQKFFIGEQVAFVDANNRLRFAVIIEQDEDTSDDRIKLRHESGTASPPRERVAHLIK